MLITVLQALKDLFGGRKELNEHLQKDLAEHKQLVADLRKRLEKQIAKNGRSTKRKT